MGERDTARGQALEESDHVGIAQPDESALGPVHLQQALDQRQERRCDAAGAVVEEAGERVGVGAVFAEKASRQQPSGAAGATPDDDRPAQTWARPPLGSRAQDLLVGWIQFTVKK
ncbi:MULTISPECIES: hypothetical protein [Streptomyces]|uniref:Uncharacterized protein n=1 Tax=Streptomyces evansiae TaxID=3075535 RepID=A0ABU2QSN6_9ACTN|nr:MULTISPECIES: hypothetical protein [unclassified Streptomyces]MDT0407457.1 hypothetical protein [Streptomyces sp. DSM 41979]MYQ59618.1 hypothetical protein [Streptomyces sp. SID4926]SCD49536.1 hypothetical protein GA0115252_10779 [Streptomyces sp. DfronAA-171]